MELQKQKWGWTAKLALLHGCQSAPDHQLTSSHPLGQQLHHLEGKNWQRPTLVSHFRDSLSLDWQSRLTKHKQQISHYSGSQARRFKHLKLTTYGWHKTLPYKRRVCSSDCCSLSSLHPKAHWHLKITDGAVDAAKWIWTTQAGALRQQNNKYLSYIDVSSSS